MNLVKLAINFSATNPQVDTTIVSLSSVQIIKDNVNNIEELSENEKQVLEEIRNK